MVTGGAPTCRIKQDLGQTLEPRVSLPRQKTQTRRLASPRRTEPTFPYADLPGRLGRYEYASEEVPPGTNLQALSIAIETRIPSWSRFGRKNRRESLSFQA
jgi:hypothetical protein